MSQIFATSFDTHTENFPEYLRSYDALAQYFRAQLDGLSTTEKGSKFAQAVAKLVPQTDMGALFDVPSLNSKKSRDGGIDLKAKSKDGNNLYIQSKLWIDKSEEIDGILSKFNSYVTSIQEESSGQLAFNFGNLESKFMIVTLSPLKNLIKLYEKKAFSSREFYKELIKAKRIQFIDGHQILSILQIAYSKINKVDTKITLDFETSIIRKDNVFIGIVSNTLLKKLYEQIGDALFFENIRDFLGVTIQQKSSTKTPNKEIIKTITNEAEKMLSRNNGIVFSASKVEFKEQDNHLILHNGSVVNGCQTTMCIVEYAKQDCYVLVKVVEINESWDIATSANYQNSVTDIDLELAQYLRPQLLKRAAALSGVQISSSSKSPFQIIEDIYDRRVVYDETRLIYIGIFSKSPKNLFEANYTHLLQDLIRKFYLDDIYGSGIFDILFSLQTASQTGLRLAKETFKNPSYASMFDRLYKDESLTYRCFISILALCVLVNIDISDRNPDTTLEYARVKVFFSEAQKVLDNKQEDFLKCYLYAVKLWMQEMNVEQETTEIQQNMHRRSRSLNFSNMYRALCMERDMQGKIDEIKA